jgi:hypothetical protein
MKKGLILACCLMHVAVLEAKVYKGAEYRTKESYLYGRFEVRMMSSQREGMLSSFFTYNDSIPFDASKWNEIDIEILGRYTDDVQFNVITPGTVNHIGRRGTPFNPSLGFHTYAIEWTPAYVAWFIDGAEALRQTGAHIQTLIHSQKIMMNIWIPIAANWAGAWNDNVLPAFASYDYVSYAAYTPGAGSVGSNSDFTPKWKDDFDAYDAVRWDRASHTWAENQCDFIPDNIVFRNGCMILCLTKETATGYTDNVPPNFSSVRAEADGVVLNFMEEVDSISAVNPGNYLVPHAAISKIDLLSDKKTVRISLVDYDTSALTNIVIMNIKDRFVPPNTMPARSVNITKAQPLALPVKINCGGPAYKDYLADQMWSGTNMEYGHLDGWANQNGATVSGASDPIVYQTELAAAAEYRIRIPNGRYLVLLMMAENYFTAPGKRIFDIAVQGTIVEKDLDLFAKVGKGVQYQKAVPNVNVTEGIIDIHLMSTLDNSLLNGIVIMYIGTGINKDNGRLPEVWKIGQNYPNPFNAATVIPYALSGDDRITITFYDALGRNVSEHPLGEQHPGEHLFVWDGKSTRGTALASGVYYCTVQGSHRQATRKLMFLQ